MAILTARSRTAQITDYFGLQAGPDYTPAESRFKPRKKCAWGASSPTSAVRPVGNNIQVIQFLRPYADPFLEISFRYPLKISCRDYKWFRVGLRIVDLAFDLQIIVIQPFVPLCDVNPDAVRMAHINQPRSFIASRRVHNKRTIVFPEALGISPSRLKTHRTAMTRLRAYLTSLSERSPWSPPVWLSLSKVPSGNWILLRRPTFRPVLDWNVYTVIMSPGFREVRVQPTKATADGLPSSTVQCAAAALSSFASRKISACGLGQRYFVTIASFKITGLVMSYAAAP